MGDCGNNRSEPTLLLFLLLPFFCFLPSSSSVVLSSSWQNAFLDPSLLTNSVQRSVTSPHAVLCAFFAQQLVTDSSSAFFCFDAAAQTCSLGSSQELNSLQQGTSSAICYKRKSDGEHTASSSVPSCSFGSTSVAVGEAVAIPDCAAAYGDEGCSVTCSDKGFVSTFLEAQQGACKSPFRSTPYGCIFHEDTSVLSWAAARKQCHALAAELATPGSGDRASIFSMSLTDAYPNSKRSWVGVFRMDFSSPWQYLDGAEVGPAGEFPWAADEPRSDNENFVFALMDNSPPVLKTRRVGEADGYTCEKKFG